MQVPYKSVPLSVHKKPLYDLSLLLYLPIPYIKDSSMNHIKPIAFS